MLPDKTLRWCDSYRSQGGWAGQNYDTGLCNRILHWEVAYLINKAKDFSHTIILEELYWPEFKLLSMPNTKAILTKKNIYGEYTFTKDATSISELEIHRIFRENDFILNNKDHLYSDFGWTVLKHIQVNKSIDINTRPLTKIKLLHQQIEDLIRENLQGAVGIHIRRNNCIYKNQDDRKSLPREVRAKLPVNTQNKDSVYYMELGGYAFHRDGLYYNIIDNMLELNPSQKFYLSCDLPHELISYYYNKYGSNMISKNKLINQTYDLLLTLGYKKKDFVFGNVVENIVDLFSLSFCDFLIKSPDSTWSEFAELYQLKTAVEVTDSWETDIKELYLLYLNKSGINE